ncbi:protease complex subunit PrcB family protein [Flavobacterium agrisoli]|uniref:Protease complex subunit PrcB family protein n=1 Tax=Flavobacterium agrisoli TaxID=2793066 RepID=A0A934UL59_9FLAO|nr:protease complex subunit PrcB family protein [Flavobacterium agrisoli]MBK0371219.1 protease complex subunit PrcB family protein [Flavobacterium agrisoli]
MKKILLGLFIAIGLTSCDLNDNTDMTTNCGVYENMYFTSYPIDCNYTITSMPTTAGVLVVSSQEKMDSFFTPNATPCTDTSIPSNIDFSTTMLVGIFAGPKSTTGYEIAISSIVENDCEVVVQYYEKEPEEGTDTSATLNNPYDFVLIPKTTKSIYFNRVSEINNYMVVGSFGSLPTQDLYSETDLNIMRYLNVPYGNFELNQFNFQSLTKKGNYTEFLKTVPAEILALNGQTKTYGAPNAADQGGIYFQLIQNGVKTTVFFDTADTADQSTEIIAFKKSLQERMASYE